MNIRKLARPAAALLAAAALMAGIPELRMEAQAAFPEYLKSVTYFGDAWPINYWGTEDDNMGANFARIKADGFNSIILVIPWREFQPGDMGNMYNEAAFAKLDQVMKCAVTAGITAVTRPFRSDMPVWCRTEAMTGSCGWITVRRSMTGYPTTGTFRAVLLPGRTSGTIRQTWTRISQEPSVSVWHPDADIRIT